MMMSGTDKVIWFTQNKSGMLVLNRPDGTKTVNRRKYDTCDPMVLYFERAKMYMQENGIWDATAFACTVQTLLYFQPRYTIDFAELEDGSWKIIEAGDGSVSGLSDGQNYESFFRKLFICCNEAPAEV